MAASSDAPSSAAWVRNPARSPCALAKPGGARQLQPVPDDAAQASGGSRRRRIRSAWLTGRKMGPSSIPEIQGRNGRG